MTELFLGRTAAGADVRLPASALLRHVVCLGSSGSGKTVTCKAVCEELIRNDVPVIAVDPQGDIASLAEIADEASVVAHNTPAEVRATFAAKAEVVVWTPGSALGVPLSVNPLAATRGSGGAEEVLRERNFAAEAIADLAGFDLRSAEGRTVTTVFSLLLEHAAESERPVEGIDALARLLESMPSELRDRVSSVAEENVVDELGRRTRMLSMGPTSLLLSGGIPLDIDTLLGRGSAGAAPGKTRLSVIYLNTLATERERLFFVGQLAQSLYRWMLRHPSPTPQALFYVDEIAPYLPPVRKPVCKDALGLLFRQGRKYGIACLAATQSPGDLDYKALGQIATWSLGRLVVRQDVKKVETQLKSLDPDAAEEITKRLPALVPGQSILFAPDVLPAPVELHTRWLVTRHRTLDEQTIATATAPEVRARLEEAGKERVASTTGEATSPGTEDATAGPALGRAEVAVLAVTGEGTGTVGACEIVVRRGGTGRVTALGGQSKVSKESIKVAWEAASQLQVELDLPRNGARRYDVTVLDTRLAIKKDGPSAGLAYLTGIVAAFRGTPPRPDVAMTGEITILGKVLAVGGIEEKVRAAYEAGYATVLVPAENRGEVALLPADLKQAVEVVPVATVQEALPVIFAAPRRARPEPPTTPLPTVAPLRDEPAPETAPPEPAEEPAETSLDDRIGALLGKEPAAFTTAEIAERLDESAAGVTRAVKRLAEAGTARVAKRGRAAVYYHATHALRPEYDLLGPVEAVKLAIYEPDARHRAEGQLASSYLIFAREEIVSQRLAYLPLLKVRFTAKVREGWLFKQEVERRDNLYFSGVTAELMSYTSSGFAFTADVPTNPVEVVDLDNLAAFESRAPGELELLDTEMTALLDRKAVEASALKKFQLTVLEVGLVFFPVWRFLVRDKQNGSERDVCIDGLKGQALVLGAVKSGRKKK